MFESGVVLTEEEGSHTESVSAGVPARFGPVGRWQVVDFLCQLTLVYPTIPSTGGDAGVLLTLDCSRSGVFGGGGNEGCSSDRRVGDRTGDDRTSQRVDGSPPQPRFASARRCPNNKGLCRLGNHRRVDPQRSPATSNAKHRARPDKHRSGYFPRDPLVVSACTLATSRCVIPLAGPHGTEVPQYVQFRLLFCFRRSTDNDAVPARVGVC